MGYDAPHPEFSWSPSRDRVLAECARAYYWRYYGSHGGWLQDAPQQARQAYALKQLTTFPLLVGPAVHEWARDCAPATGNGVARPSFEVMLARRGSARPRPCSLLPDPQRPHGCSFCPFTPSCEREMASEQLKEWTEA
jgi:hypothetical protein